MKRKLAQIGEKILVSTLVAALVLTSFTFADLYCGTNFTSMKVEAAGLTGSSTTVDAPGYNASNIPSMDTTGKVAYWYAGNKFLALNQFNGGADSTQAASTITVGTTDVTDGTMKFYNDSGYGYRGIETTNDASERADKKALQTTLTVTSTASNSDKQTYVQAQNDSFFENGAVWELMDSDAVWDDDYLFAQYRSGSFATVTTEFQPSILTTVESWYDNGFKTASGAGGTAVSAQGDYFSTAEKSHVKSATVITDGVNGSTNSTTDDSITAHLFAPSVDEVYYNPQQVKSVFDAFKADSNAGRTQDSSWRYARSHLWLRSFWGVLSSCSHRLGVDVHSSGTFDGGNVAGEFAVAPAFYLDTKGVIMAKDATNAAATAAANASATLNEYSASAADDNNSVKFLINNSELAPEFTTSISQKKVSVEAADTYSINYSGAVTTPVSDAGNQNDSRLVVSALLYDENGKILYYGVLGEVTGESGSVDFTVPAIPEGKEYTLAVFEEQLGGSSVYKTSGNVSYTSYETDYQSGGVSYTTVVNEQVENATGFDANTWYEYKDTISGIIWKYKLNANGDVIGLYTENNDISSIIDSGKCLNVPSKINGRTVIAIGGENAEQPFIPASQRGWTSISFPSTMTTINDYAFMDSTSEAKITIPSNIKAIGIKAFYNSNITSVVLSEFSGTIGSYAFGSTSKLTTATIKGGGSGLTLSSVAFADSALTDLSITGNVTINKKAFRNNSKLKNVNLNGIIAINENAFSDCTSLSNLNISSSVTIGSYAFNGCTALESLYLPNGTVLSEYSFNGCTGITSLEADCSLPAHSFENTGNIKLIVLDATCANVAYNWEGNVTNFSGEDTTGEIENDSYGSAYHVREFTNPGRTIYAQNSSILYGFNHEDSYLSAFGASGTVQVYIPFDENYDTGVEIKEGNSLSIFGMTLYSDSSYDDYKNAGGNTSVMVSPVGNIEALMSNRDIVIRAESDATKTQTGISAYYTGTILTTKDIDKNNMTVIKMYGAEEGDEYTASEYYVIRTSEFNAELSSQLGVTEEKIASYEPITATEEDLASGQTTGTISATVVVFYEDNKYFSAPVSIRVEEYTAKTYIEHTYGSYDAVAAAFVEYEERIAELENALASADVDSIESLTNELAACKAKYAELVELLSSYVSDNTTDDTGYFGTTTGPDGQNMEVVFIEGNATSYTDTAKTDSEGNAIYQASYDVNDDGNPEDIYFTVKADGIHLTDSDGNPVKIDGTQPGDGESGAVISDKLGALQRQLTAQIDSLKEKLDACDAGVAKIKESISDAGLNFDELEGETDYDKISNAINSLTADLSDAQNKIINYQNALNTIYDMLTGESLSSEDAASLTNSLNAINTKITKLQSDLDTAKGNVTTLQAALKDAEDRISDLESQLGTKDTEISDLQSQLDAKNVEISNLQSQLDALAGTAQSYLVTATMANNLFNSNLDADASPEEIEAVINQFVANKLAADETITAIQDLLGTTATGEALVSEVSLAIDNSNSSQPDYTGYTKDTEVNTDSASYKSGYDAGVASVENTGDGATDYTGYTKDTEVNKDSASYKSGYDAGVASVENSGDGTIDYTGYTKDTEENPDSTSYKNGYSKGYSAGQNSVNTETYYNNGYSAGYTAGVNSVNSNSSTESTKAYNNGYNEGYSEGKKAVNTDSYYNKGYNKGYSEGYTEGVASVDVSVNSSTYKSGYNAGYADGKKAATGIPTGTTVTTVDNSKNNTPVKTENTPQTIVASSDEEKSTTDSPEIELDEDGEELEGTTRYINATTKPEAVPMKVEIGTVVTRSLPTSTTVNPEQSASTTIIFENKENVTDIKSNAQSFEQASAKQQDNALKMLDFYKNNLDELGKLGSDDVMNALTNDQMDVTFDVLASIDVTPSEKQIADIAAGKEIEVTFTSSAFENDLLYLMIHESDKREGEFDVVLTKAKDNTVSMNLKDLSPITIAKITVGQKQMVETESSETTDVGEAEAFLDQNEDQSSSVVLFILVFVAVVVLGVLFILIKKRGGFSSSGKKH